MSKMNPPKGVKVLTRRDFLKISGVSLAALSLSPLLNSCSPASTPAPKIGGRLDFLSWEGYDFPTCLQTWEKANGLTMSSSYIGDQSEIQTKLLAGASVGYDLISYYNGTANLYIDELKLLQPIDMTKVPNFKNTYKWFQTANYWVRNGVQWGIPFTWNAEGCVYNSDKMEPIVSWLDLLKPQFKNKIALVDDGYGMILMAGVALGMSDSLPNLSQQEFAEVKKFLLQLKGQARGISASYGDQSNMMISGEAIAAFPGWAALCVWAAASKVTLKMNIPQEGGFATTDAFAIPKGSDNVESALAWINEVLTPENQACEAMSLAAGVVIPKAYPLLSQEVASMYDYSDIESYLTKKVRLYGYPPSKSDQYATFDDWNNMWLEVKAA